MLSTKVDEMQLIIKKYQNPRRPPQKKQENVVKLFIANFQSIRNKSADFAAFDETERPDVILGCESWLHGNIASAEIFPSHFQVTRNDRNTNGGGVFVATKDTIPRLERPDLSSGNSEITWCQLLLDNTSMFFGSYWPQVAYRSEKMFHTKINTKMPLFCFNGAYCLLLP